MTTTIYTLNKKGLNMHHFKMEDLMSGLIIKAFIGIIALLVVFVVILGTLDYNCSQRPNTFAYTGKCVQILDHEYDITAVTVFDDFNGQRQLIIEARSEQTNYDLFIWDGEDITNIGLRSNIGLNQSGATVSPDGRLIVYEEYDFAGAIFSSDQLMGYDLFNEKHFYVTTKGVPTNPVFATNQLLAYKSVNVALQSESIYMTDLYHPQTTWQISPSYDFVRAPRTDVSGEWISWSEDDGSTPVMLYNIHSGESNKYGQISELANQIEWPLPDCGFEYHHSGTIRCANQ